MVGKRGGGTVLCRFPTPALPGSGSKGVLSAGVPAPLANEA